MKYALVGCGRIATNHMTAATNNCFDIVTVCDHLADKTQSLLEGHGLGQAGSIRRYENHKEMLEKEEIDLVSIATESGSHAAVAHDCIEAGIHVIIEKPIALSILDADSIIEHAKKNRVKVAACHQNRFNAAIQELKKAIDSGRFGKLSHGSIHVRWNRGESYYRQAPWRGTWAQDGGTLMNQCIHGIDLLRWLFGGEITEVFGVTRQQFHPYIEAEDIGMAVLQFGNGAIATVEGTTNVFPNNLEETLYVFGENGTVKIGGTSTNNIDVWQFADEQEADQTIAGMQEATSNVYGNGHTALFADMAGAIIQNRPPYIDARAGRDALEVVLAIYKSQKEGGPVRLPLAEFSSLDMAGSFADPREI
jgi:predicted dehydrogenase